MMHTFILELTKRCVHMYIACTYVCMYAHMYMRNSTIYTCAWTLTQVIKMTKKEGLVDDDTVQLNSNLILTHVSLAETRIIFKFAHDLVVSARACLG